MAQVDEHMDCVIDRGLVESNCVFWDMVIDVVAGWCRKVKGRMPPITFLGSDLQARTMQGWQWSL